MNKVSVKLTKTMMTIIIIVTIPIIIIIIIQTPNNCVARLWTFSLACCHSKKVGNHCFTQYQRKRTQTDVNIIAQLHNIICNEDPTKNFIQKNLKMNRRGVK